MNAQQLKELEFVNVFAVTYGNHGVHYYAKLPASQLDAWYQQELTKSSVNVYIMRRFVRAAHHFANIINMQQE